jgi:hypothetical protein
MITLPLFEFKTFRFSFAFLPAHKKSVGTPPRFRGNGSSSVEPCAEEVDGTGMQTAQRGRRYIADYSCGLARKRKRNRFSGAEAHEMLNTSRWTEVPVS